MIRHGYLLLTVTRGIRQKVRPRAILATNSLTVIDFGVILRALSKGLLALRPC